MTHQGIEVGVVRAPQARIAGWFGGPGGGNRTGVVVAALALALAFVAAPALAGGFAVEDTNAKAAALGGAFVGLADDATTMATNPGGLGLIQSRKKKKGAVGVSTLVLQESLYQGLPPGPGAGTTGEQDLDPEILAHVYAIKTLHPRITAGLAVHQPFLLSTAWDNSNDDFPGRTINLSSRIRAWDLQPTLGLQLSSTVGLGVGAIYRLSDFDLSDIIQVTDPFDPTGVGTIDLADRAVSGDLEGGFGWTAGFLHRPSDAFSWGLSYRSAVEIDFTGSATLTQRSTGDPQLDELFKDALPFGQELGIASSLEFPASASLGLALAPSKSFLLVAQVDWTEWESIDRFAVDYTTEPSLDQTFVQSFENAFTYRLGAQVALAGGLELRAGVAFHETPQPDEAVGFFFVDSDKLVYSAGIGKDWLQVAFRWEDYDQRIVTTTLDDFNGNFRQSAWSLGVTALF